MSTFFRNGDRFFPSCRRHRHEKSRLSLASRAPLEPVATAAKIAAIRALAEHTTIHVRQRLPKIYCGELVDVIFEQPNCRICNLVEKNIAQRQSASRYLKELAALGVLREVRAGKEKLFIHPKLMQLLADDSNAFAPYA